MGAVRLKTNSDWCLSNRIGIAGSGSGPPIAAAGVELVGNNWEENYDYLWDYLIPSRGPAFTVQGEVIRIAGRVADELLRNYGGNWDRAYRQMLHAYLKHVASHNSLREDEVSALTILIADFDTLMNETSQLRKYAVKWVSQNLSPIELNKPSYNR